MRALIRLLAYPALLLAGLWLLLATRFGVVMLALTGETASLGRLQVEDARGSLLEGISFQQLRWTAEGQTIDLGPTQLKWRFAREDDVFGLHLHDSAVASIRIEGGGTKDDSDPQADRSASLPELSLPINIVIQQFRLGPVVFDDTTLIDTATLSIEWLSGRAVIHQLNIQRPGESLAVFGELTSTGDWPLTLEVAADISEPEQQLELNLTGSVAELTGHWRVRGWVSGSGTLAATPFQQEAELSGEMQSGPLMQLDPALGVAELNAQLGLQWQQGLRGTAQLMAGSNRLQVQARASGIEATLEAPQPEVILVGLTGELSANGTWQAGSAGRLSAIVDWRRLSLPDGKTGDLSASLEGPLDRLQINADLTHPDTEVKLAAVLAPKADSLILSLQNLNIRAPDNRLFRLQDTVNVSLARQKIELPRLCLRADDSSGFCATVQQENGVMTGQGRIERFPLALLGPWAEPGPWREAVLAGDWELPGNGEVILRRWSLIHPLGDAQLAGTLGLAEPWPADLSLTLSYREPQQKISLKTRGSLRQLKATLTAAGHLRGKGELKGDVLSQELQVEASLASGPLSRLLPNLGSWAPELDLNMRLRQSAIDGHLTLRAGDDRADIRLSNGDAIFDLALADLSHILPGHTGSLKGSGKLPLTSQKGEVLLDLNIRNVVMPDAVPLSASVKLTGMVSDHRLELVANRHDAQLDLALSGGLAQDDWRGNIQTLSLGLTQGPTFSNEKPASLARIDGRLLLDELCLRGSTGGSFCAEARNKGDIWSTRGTVASLPLRLLSPWLNLPPWVRADLDGEWSLDSSAGGKAELRHSRIDIPPAGITVHGSRLLLSGESLQSMVLQTETTLEDGAVKGALRIQQTDDRWELEGALSAPMLTWLRRPDIDLQMSPELTATWASGQPLTLRGTVTAGKGSVNLDKLPSSDGPVLSSDIVTQRQPRKPGLPLDIKLQLVLPKPLAITGYGFDGTTQGALQLQQTPTQTLTGNGTIKVAGRYKAWGQDLSIKDGRIYFQNSPLSEPLIDVTAQRDVGSYKVGVQALGPARNPQLTVTSKPVVNDSLALQMLVTGRASGTAASPTPDQAQLMQQALAALSVKGGNWFAENYGRNLPFDELRVEMDEEAGTPGLVLGRQVAPRLYIGYKVLLDSAVQAFQLRYTLSPSCDLTTTSALTSEGRVRCRIER